MPKFDVHFISNIHLDEDDSADFKEWKTVEAKSPVEAGLQFKGKALVLRVTESIH